VLYLVYALTAELGNHLVEPLPLRLLQFGESRIEVSGRRKRDFFTGPRDLRGRTDARFGLYPKSASSRRVCSVRNLLVDASKGGDPDDARLVSLRSPGL